MEPAQFVREVEDFVSECLISEQDLEARISLGKMKTLTAYTSSYAATTYQQHRDLTEVPAEGGSPDARRAAEEISSAVQIDAVLRLLLNPVAMRQASRL